MSWTAVIWFAAGLSAGIYAAMWICTLPRIRAAAGGRRPFDVRFGYAPEEARELLSALTPEGRALHLGPQRTLDRIFLVAWTVTLAMAVLWAVMPPLGLVLALAAVAAGVLDAIENVRVANFLRKEPGAVSDAEVRAASRTTTAKFILTGVAVAAIIIGGMLR